MISAKRKNLQRLLNPRHVAIIGGKDAEIAVRACRQIGFKGPIWPVNPKRETLAGLTCNSTVDDLPQPPDAVFLAVPAQPALEIVKRLSQLGAGGVVCYTAGFSEDGSQGGMADQPLVDVSGELALVGPNCYGLINYIDRVALWPFAHGGYSPGYGAAIITQSGMLSSDITMNQRSVPLSYMISAGNQSVLQLEDYVDVLCERDEVSAIGLHIEGLKDITAFSRVARKALELNKPIVVLKTGTSKIGSQLTISHTGSLAGTTELYLALFDRLGVICVSCPELMLETLKFISVAGIPQGPRVMGFTCSGGGATMLADYAEKINLDFPQPSAQTAAKLTKKLPVIADVTNPLDYTTPIWGKPEKVQPVFETALSDSYDVAVIVQDFPLPQVDESKPYYLNDTGAFINAVSNAGIPAAVCSTLAENIDRPTREYLVENNVAPLQGIHNALDAINHSIWYGAQRQRCLNQISSELVPFETDGETYQIDEWAGKQELRKAGFNTPPGQLVKATDAPQAADHLGFPVVLKLNSNNVCHKTEIGAVRLGLNTALEVQQAVQQMQADLAAVAPGLATDSFIVEKMLDKPVTELMVGIRQDAQFGLVMTLSSGGVLVELIADAVTLLLPATHAEINNALDKLKVSQLLNGYRGGSPVDRQKLVQTISQLAEYMQQNTSHIAELEINPMFVYSDHSCLVDVLMLRRRYSHPA